MKNFEFEHDGQKLWYSRSLACGMVVLRYDSDEHTIEVLAVKRGKGAEYNPGKWCMPGGFIDFYEDALTCARRETFEETGLDIPAERVKFLSLDTTPRGIRQTMVALHGAIFAKKETESWCFSTNHAEPDEIAAIRWVDLKHVNRYEWTRGQLNDIRIAIHNQAWILDIVNTNDYNNWYKLD